LIERSADLATLEIVVLEVLAGTGTRRDHERTLQALLSFPTLSARGLAAHLHAAEIYRTCRDAGVSVRSPVDCLVAAIAIDREAELLHADADFDRIAQHTTLSLYAVR
jgi:hypothetical protein